MKEQEITIDDIVSVITEDGSEFIGRVDSISRMRDLGMINVWVRVYSFDYAKYVDATIDQVRPIPITDDILKAYGFIIKSEQAYLIDGIFLDKGLDGNAYWWQVGHCPICAINHVNELQRALRCVGLFDIANNIKLE